MSKIITLDGLRDYLTNLKGLFVTKTDAESTYETKANAANIYETKEDAATYFNGVTVDDATVTLSHPDGSTVPVTVDNVASAGKATNDGNGNSIVDTYATKAELTAHATAAESTYVQTGAVDQTIAGTKTFSKPIVGSVTGSSGSCTGNAASATKLQTARTINGIAFDGTANITIHVTAPAGVIIPFAGTSVPTGYLLCNGAAVSRTDYANLFAAIGTLYGAGDGSTTFNLPDARDRVLQGASGTHSAGSYISAGLPNITGSMTPMCWNSAIGTGAMNLPAHKGNVTAPGGYDMGETYIFFNASRSSSYYGASTKPQVDAVAINFIIKY